MNISINCIAIHCKKNSKTKEHIVIEANVLGIFVDGRRVKLKDRKFKVKFPKKKKNYYKITKSDNPCIPFCWLKKVLLPFN